MPKTVYFVDNLIPEKDADDKKNQSGSGNNRDREIVLFLKV